MICNEWRCNLEIFKGTEYIFIIIVSIMNANNMVYFTCLVSFQSYCLWAHICYLIHGTETKDDTK